MSIWSIKRLIRDATRYYAKAVAAPLFVGCEGADEMAECSCGAEQLAEREAEEEVGEPCHCGRCDEDEARERIGEVDDFVPHANLVAGPTPAEFYMSQHKGEPWLTDDELIAVRGLIQERYGADLLWTESNTDDGQAVPTPPAAACPSPNLVDWLVPAIRTELEAHEYDRVCKDCTCGIGPIDWIDWHEHIAPLIAKRIELALRTTDFDFNLNDTMKGSE